MPMGVRTSECIALAYFLYLAGAAALSGVPRWRRRCVLTTSLYIGAAIAVLALQDGPIAVRLRDWIPLALIVAGYWLPALLVVAPNPRLEKRLLAADHRLFGPHGLALFASRAPRFIIELLEFAYLFCYPLVPLGFAWLVIAGFEAEADRFWTAVLTAAFICYGLLPWLPTRAPRALEAQVCPGRSAVRGLNLRVLDRASVQLNTFPSGHAAASLATALAVGIHVPVAGATLGTIALGIAVGSVTGRYHYGADAISGAIVALAAFAISRFL